MSSKGFILSGNEGFQVGFYYKNGGVRDKGREDMRFISHHEIEWGLIYDGVRVVIVGELNVRDFVSPGTWVGSAEDLKVCFNLLVDTFCFTVRLRMVGGGKGEVIVQEFSKLFGEGRRELWAII